MKGIRIKNLLAMMALLLFSTGIRAHDIEIDGICYNLNTDTQQATVTYQDDSYILNAYSGSIVIPSSIKYGETTYSVTDIGEYAFFGDKLTSINIPSSVTTIGKAAFGSCGGLTSIYLPDGVTSIGLFAFDNCSGLASINLPSGLTSIEQGTFNGCRNLTSITIPDGIERIGASAFAFCSNLTSITIPEGVQYVDSYAFMRCSGLTSITFPKGIYSIGSYAFYDCYNLTSIDIPENVKTIGQGVFQNCSSLTSLAIPASVNYIEVHAFQDCSALTTITIAGSAEIRGEAFYGAKELTTIIIHGGTIENKAFAECPNLKDIYNYGYNNSLGALSNDTFSTYDATLHVPEELLSAVEEDVIWRRFAKRVAMPSIKATSYTRAYGDENPVFEYITNGDIVGGKPEIICEATPTSPVGEYPIVIKRGTISNSFCTYSNGMLTIIPRPLKAVTNAVRREYGEENPDLTISYSGFANNENESVISTKPVANTTATKTSPVGEYPIKISGGRATNYEFTYEPGVLTITPAPVIAFVNDAERLYGQDNPVFFAVYTGLKNNEKQLTFTEPPSYNTEATKTSSVGKYPITLSGKPENYEIVEVNPGTLTINPAPLTIKANDISRVYYSPDQTYNFTYTGFVDDENEQVLTQKPSIETEATMTSSVGKYKIIPTNAAAKNYIISYIEGELTITKRPLKVTAHCSREYGDDNQVIPLEYIGFVNNENESVLIEKPTATTKATIKSSVGDYPITISGGMATNYEISYEQGVLTVTKAPLTAKVNDETKVYGSQNPTFTIEYDGLKNDEKVPAWISIPSIQTDATQNSDVGQYPIRALNGVPINYELKEITAGILTITPAPLTIKAKGASRMYYEDDPDFSFTCSGFVNSDNESVLTKNPTYSTDATKASNVGKYSITPSGAAAKNYEISYEQGELTITKRPLKVTSHSSREYGEENPQFPLEYDGFVNYEDASVITTKPTASTAATRRSNVGDYPITLRGGEAMNYEISCIPGTLTITKAPLTVKVNDETKVYGEQNPSFSLSFEGLKNDETVPVWTSRPTIQTEATRYSDVGQYNIKASEGVAVNYETQMLDGILDIMPAQLTIRANDASRLYYDEEPSFSYTCYGFVNGDGENALSAKPTLTTNATKTSNAGEYDIMPSGADSHNYAISYTKGTLRVLPRTLTASVGDYERIYNEENPAFTVTYDGFVGNEDERVLTTKPTAKTAATKTSDVGTYKIDVVGGEARNYGFSYVPGKLTINKAEQSIVWNQDFRGLRVGDQVELKATASSGLKVTYSMESSQPAEIYTAGTTYWLDCKAEGETQIVAVQEGNRNYYATNRIRKPLIVGPVAIVEAEEGSLVKIQSTQLGIRVTGAKPGENIRIYTIDGMLQRSVRVEEPTTYIQMKRNNIYIVRVGEKVVKLKH